MIVGLAEVEDPHHAGVVDQVDRTGFVEEAIDILLLARIGRQLRAQDFDGRAIADRILHRFIDGADTAVTDGSGYAIASDQGPDEVALDGSTHKYAESRVRS